MGAETDGQLVVRARGGNLSAFEEMVARHRAALVALVAARLGSLAEAEDVAQEAFVQAFFRLHQLRDPEALLPWLRRVAERIALMRLRSRREEAVDPAEVERMRGVPVEPPGSGDGSGLLTHLPEAMRRTVALTYLAGYTCAEAAALLGVREGTVKSRLSRARAILKEAFEMTENELSQGKPQDDFTEKTIARLMREARRLLRQGDPEGAAERANRVLGMQVQALFAAGDPPGFRFHQEAVRMAGLSWKEQRRREAEANAAQYGFRLAELDWEVADVDMMEGTLGKPTGRGDDVWGVPHTRMKVRTMDDRDICRRLQCSPIQLYEWVQQGCPVLRCHPFVRFDLDRVKQWIADNHITGWPKPTPQQTDLPIRLIFKALYSGEIDPERAEEIISGLGWGWC